jgi:cytochrome c oxidase assembly protein subunit 15
MSLTGAQIIQQEAPQSRAERGVRLWLFAVAALVFAIVVVGGATRLTDSGLSITEWKPILGAIPPLSEADWRIAFEKYKQIPEYQIVNKGMSLEAFKFIYWWEWAHRFLGRLIGVAFALPFAWFWIKGRLREGLAPKLAGILALGGLQGAIGWYMVSSGLVDRVDVSQYRLALHLAVAFVILGLLIWVALDLGADPGDDTRVMGGDRRVAALLTALVLLQVVLGAFVAGLKAGLAHNTWPLMDGRLVPPGLGAMSPWYLNLFENTLTVQFNHRLLAYVLVAVSAWHWWSLKSRGAGQACDRSLVLLLAMLVQAALGIWTLLAHVPLWLGLVHQGGAALVLAVAVWHLHGLKRPSRA